MTLVFFSSMVLCAPVRTHTFPRCDFLLFFLFIFIFPHHSANPAQSFLARQIFHTHQSRLSPPDKLHYVRAASSNHAPPPLPTPTSVTGTWLLYLTKGARGQRVAALKTIRTRASCLMTRDINQEGNLLSQIHRAIAFCKKE